MIKGALKQFLTYGAGNIAQWAAGIVLLPLYLHYFEPSQYGVISLLAVVTSLLSSFASAGVTSGLFRLYYEAEPSEAKRLAGNSYLWYLASAALVGIALFTLASRLSLLFFHSIDYTYPIRLVGIFFFLSLAQIVPFTTLQLSNKAGFYVGFSLFKFLLDFGLKFYFIALLGRGIAGYFEAGVIAYTIVLCCMQPFVLKYFSLSFNAQCLRQLLRLGSPFILSTFAMWTLSLSDRFLLNYFRDETAVGIYSLAYSFATIFPLLLSTPISLFISPFFFSFAAKSSPEDTKRFLQKLLSYLFIAGAVLYLAITLGCGDILRIFTFLFGAKEAYYGAVVLVPLLTLAPFLYLLMIPPGMALLLAKKPEFNAVAAAICAVVSLGLNFILIPKLGAPGAAITAVIAYTLYGVLCFWWAQRIYTVQYSWGHLVKGCFFLIIAFAIGWTIRISQPWFSLITKAGLGIIVFSLLVWFVSGILTRAEKSEVLTHIPILRAHKTRILK
ncbi:MAG: oligosaccharide flippase family protein [Dehalococcoidales bacterium]|nr:oligosaccharide flippase family protein [Dehalococcoidales bacterium]